MKYSDHQQNRSVSYTRNSGRQTRNTQDIGSRAQTELSKSPPNKSSNNYVNGEKSYTPRSSNYASKSFYLTGWGNSKFNQIVIPSPTQPNQSDKIQKSQIISNYGNGVINVSAGENHTAIINQRGELLMCGNNSYGQLGIEGMSCALQPTIIPHLKDFKIQAVSCGSQHTFALTSTGEVYAWGLNLKGQLGLGNFESRTTPTLVMSLIPNGNNNSKVRKSVTESMIHQRMKSANDMRVATEQSVDSRSLKERSSSIDNILLQLQNFKNGGNNLNKMTDQMRKNSDLSTQSLLLNVLLSMDQRVIAISCGALHTLVLTNQNRVFSAGYGETYALGHGDNITCSDFKQVTTIQTNSRMSNISSSSNIRIQQIEKIFCGLSTSGCLVNGKPQIWGVCGQKQSLIFKTPTILETSFDQSNPIVDLKLGDFLVMMLSSRGDVLMMGENNQGQLGNESLSLVYETPVKLQNFPPIAQIACGRNHCLAVAADLKSIYGWGNNQFGQITGSIKSGPLITPRPIQFKNIDPFQIECGTFHTMMLSNKIAVGNDTVLFEQVENDNLGLLEIQKQNNREEIEKYKEMYEKLKNDNQALQVLNIQLLQKNDKLKSDVSQLQQITHEGSAKKCDARTQTVPDGKNDQENDLKQRRMNGSEQNLGLNDKKPHTKFEITGLDLSPERSLKHRIFNSNLDIDYNQIVIEQQISEGGYGIIYKGKWRETTVAIKKFKVDGMNESGLRDFLSECHAMEALRHPNIVMFIGACTKPPNFCIILEYCSRGALWNILQNPDIELSWENRRKIALDAARGVLYLHQCKPPILHRDLQSLNLLLDDSFKCKLADFGWTRSLSNYMTGKIGTYQWMAPEVIGGKTYTEKADVFSFSIIMWEIASREPPYRNISGLQVSIDVFSSDLRPTIPKKTPDAFAKLTRRCWEREPEKRPSFREIIKDLETMNLSV